MNIHDLKARIDLRAIAEQVLGSPARRSYHYVQFRAPDRDDRTPSLTVWANGFKDFGAPDQHGDVFDFLSRYGDHTFQEAIALIGGADPLRQVTYTHQPSTLTSTGAPDPAWQHAAESALRRCQAALQLNPAARHYLHQQGYSDATIELRGLGFNPDWMRLDWKKPDGKAAWLPPGVVFPWYQQGQLYALKVRTAHGTYDQPDAVARLLGRPPESAKYMQVAGGRISQAWYGSLEQPYQPLVLCEGEKDCDNLYQALNGCANVITLGSASGRLPDSLVQHIEQVAWVAVVLDNDDAGQHNAARLQAQLSQRLSMPILIEQVPLPYKDITDWILDGGDVGAWFSILNQRAQQASWDIESATYFIQGVPNTLRELILGLHQISRPYLKDQANAVLVLELWHEAVRQGRLDPTVPFTITQLEATQQRGSSATSIRRGLEQLVGLGLVDFLANFQPQNQTLSDPTEGGEFAKKSRRGRPSIGYRFRPLSVALMALVEQLERRLREAVFANHLPDHARPDWFEAWVDADEAERLTQLVEAHSGALYRAYAVELARAENHIARQVSEWRQQLQLATLATAPSTPLPTALNFSCGREYRDAYYHALIEAAGPAGRQISRTQASAQIGVNSRTLSQVRRRVKVVAEPRFRYFAIRQAKHVTTTADHLAPWAAQRAYGRYFESSSGACVRVLMDNDARNEGWVARQLAQGHQVWLKVQVASLERFATPDEVISLEAPQQPSPSSRVACEQQPSAEVCPPGPTGGYVRDQLRLRFDYIQWVVASDAVLWEVLTRLRVLNNL